MKSQLVLLLLFVIFLFDSVTSEPEENNNEWNGNNVRTSKTECKHIEEKLQDLLKGQKVDMSDSKSVVDLISTISAAELETFKKYRELCQDSPNYESLNALDSPLKSAEATGEFVTPEDPKDHEEIVWLGKNPIVTHHEESFEHTTVGDNPGDIRIHRSGNTYHKTSSTSHSHTIVESDGDSDDDDSSTESDDDDDDDDDDSSDSMSSILVEDIKPISVKLTAITPIEPLPKLQPITVEETKQANQDESRDVPSTKCEEVQIELDETLAREHHALDMVQNAKKTIIALQAEIADLKAKSDFDTEHVAEHVEPVPCKPTIVEQPAETPVNQTKTECDDEIVEDPAERAAIFRKRIDVNDGFETQCAKVKLLIDHPDSKKKSVIKTIARLDLEGLVHQIQVDDDFLGRAKEFASALPAENKKAQQVTKLIVKCFPDTQLGLSAKKPLHSYNSFNEQTLPQRLTSSTSYYNSGPEIPTESAILERHEFPEMPRLSRSFSYQQPKPQQSQQFVVQPPKPTLQRLVSMPPRQVTQLPRMPQMPRIPPMPKMPPVPPMPPMPSMASSLGKQPFSSQISQSGFRELNDIEDDDEEQAAFEKSINDQENDFRSKFL